MIFLQLKTFIVKVSYQTVVGLRLLAKISSYSCMYRYLRMLLKILVIEKRPE